MADPQIRALEKFFRSAVQGLDAASQAVVTSRAEALKQITQAELRSQFKRRVGGVSLKSLPPTARFGPAAYVSVKPQFLKIFQDGGTVRSPRSTLLIVRLPEGARLKFPRVGKKGWAAVYQRYKDRLSIVRSGDGWLVLAKVGKKQVGVYFLTRQVQEKKRLNFSENAERVGRGMADEIQRLMEGKIDG
jgi:hypothetical protein